MPSAPPQCTPPARSREQGQPTVLTPRDAPVAPWRGSWCFPVLETMATGRGVSLLQQADRTWNQRAETQGSCGSERACAVLGSLPLCTPIAVDPTSVGILCSAGQGRHFSSLPILSPWLTPRPEETLMNSCQRKK